MFCFRIVKEKKVVLNSKDVELLPCITKPDKVMYCFLCKYSRVNTITKY